MEAWRTFLVLTWHKEVNSLASCNKTTIWVKTIVKRLPFFTCKCFDPTLAHLSLAVKGCPDRQAGRQRGKGCLPSVWDFKGSVLAEFTGDVEQEREKGREKAAYGVKQASLLVSVSFIFLHFTLCQCLRISFWRLCVSSTSCLSVFPQMRQKTMTALPFLYHR